MTKSAFILCLILILSAQNSIAQEITNLVPNGDFEEVQFCFDPINSLWRVPHWSAAVPNNFCSSDYYNKCQINRPWLPKEPLTGVRGNGSAAIILKTIIPNHREYLQCKLIDHLLPETDYKIELKIKPIFLENYGTLGINQFEVVFSVRELSATIINLTPSIIDTLPSVSFSGTFVDTGAWYKLHSIYRAIGNEHYLTLGVFSTDSLVDFLPIDGLVGQLKTAYYLIDDVMVYKASDTIKKQPEPILPNVFSPNQDGINEVYAIENLPEGSTLEVFNRWGSLVFKQAPYQNNWPGNAPNGNPLADGVYFAILSYQDQTGKLQQKKQTVHVVR